jgi:iron complex outermembrane receptor protein
LLALLLFVGLGLGLPIHAMAEEEEDLDFFELSLDDLGSLDIEVTSVSKKAQRMSAAPAAIAVITGEEIRRSGITSIPEALRLVPGLQVSKIDSNRWAISSRGFGGEYSDKLLVLMDGRSVYTPVFGGVYWDVQDTLVADIERIEVIRGPGATVWGANAVNGVINIITKHASKTHGGHLDTAGGKVMQRDTGFRWGGQVGEDFHYRGYGKYKEIDTYDAISAAGVASPGTDDWHQGRGGFRVDWAPTEKGALTFQGDYYKGSLNRSAGLVPIMLDDSVAPDVNMGGANNFISASIDGQGELSGGNLLGRYSHNLTESMNATAQMYWDHTVRDSSTLGETRDTVDIDLQHNFSLDDKGAPLDMIWGMAYRYTKGESTGTFNIALLPEDRTDHLFTGFLQADWRVVPDKLTLTAGSKFERNDYTGFEWQPSVRAAYTPSEAHTFWTAGSRAVHTPTWVDDDLVLTNTTFPQGAFGGGQPPFPMAVQILGRNAANVLYSGSLGTQSEHRSEVLYAVEAGYRFNWKGHGSLDLAGYWNHYDRVRNTNQLAAAAMVGGGGPGTYLVTPILLVNGQRGTTLGFEALASYKVCERVRVSTFYNYIKFDTKVYKGDVADLSGATPKHQWHARAAVDLPLHTQFDTLVWYVGKLAGNNVPSYWRLDMRLGYKPVEWLDLSFVAQNVTDAAHTEQNSGFGAGGVVPRSYFGKATIEF